MGARHRSRSRSRGRDKHRERDRRDQRSRSRHRRDRSRQRHSTSHSRSKRSRSSSWHRSRSRSPLSMGTSSGASSSRHHTHHRHSRRDNRSSPSSITKFTDTFASTGNGNDITTSSTNFSVSATATATASNLPNFDLNENDKLLMETLKTIEAVKASNLLKAAKAAEEAEKNMTPEEREREERRKKRKSRWNGSEHDKTFIPGMPTTLPCTLNKEQEQAYLYQLQIEDISRKLRSGDLGIPINIEERSPSPEPIYSSDGKRLNTREFRVRKRLEEERHSLILKMQTINPEFKPPLDYKPPVIKVNDKVMIPQEEYPDINFVGLLIGPRGNTLKNMERDTGAKIIIRGKGSIKEGKVGRKDGQPLPGEDEPLHAYITGMNAEAVKKAVDKVKEVIKQGIEVPENQNDLRRMQLRELAQLNGTLREGDGMRCSNCAATDHKTWQCPDKPNVTNTIMCTNCGSAGHIAKDCRTKTSPATTKEKTKIDEEYMHLMAELGEATAPITMTSSSSTLNSNQNVFDTSSQTKGPMKALMAPSSQALAQPTSPGGGSTSGAGGWPPMTPSTKNMPQPLMQHLQPPPPSLVHQHYNHHLGPQTQSSTSLPQHHFAQSHQWPPPPPPPPPSQPAPCPNSWMQSSATAGVGSNANAQPPLPPGSSCNYANPYLNQKNSPKTIPTTAPWPPPHAMNSGTLHPPPQISPALPPSNSIPPLPPYNWSQMSTPNSLLPPPPPGLDMNILLAAPPPPPPPPPPATV